MRRKEREITDSKRIMQIIASCKYMRLGFNDDGQIYIVPLSYGFLAKDGACIFYFHGAKEGRKIALIRKNPYVGFELDTNVKIRKADVACSHSAFYQSIIGNGYVHIVEEAEEKKIGLSAIMKQNTGKSEWDFSEEAARSVCVFKMVVEQLSCKEHIDTL